MLGAVPPASCFGDLLRQCRREFPTAFPFARGDVRIIGSAEWGMKPAPGGGRGMVRDDSSVTYRLEWGGRRGALYMGRTHGWRINQGTYVSFASREEAEDIERLWLEPCQTKVSGVESR